MNPLLQKLQPYPFEKLAALKAGCTPNSIMVGPVRGAHPGATARIGTVVNENLETRIKNLYVSDASVLPEALDRPVVLTIVSLSKRLADHLRTKVFQNQQVGDKKVEAA